MVALSLSPALIWSDELNSLAVNVQIYCKHHLILFGQTVLATIIFFLLGTSMGEKLSMFFMSSERMESIVKSNDGNSSGAVDPTSNE